MHDIDATDFDELVDNEMNESEIEDRIVEEELNIRNFTSSYMDGNVDNDDENDDLDYDDY